MHHCLLWIPPHHVIIILVLIYQIRTIPMKIKPIQYSQGEFIQKVNINTDVFGISNIQYHDFDNGDALTFTDKYTAL